MLACWMLASGAVAATWLLIRNVLCVITRGAASVDRRAPEAS